jgi:hypothetical protein
LTVVANFFNAAFGGVLVGCSAFVFVGFIFYSASKVILDAARKGYVIFDHFFEKLNSRFQTTVNPLTYVISLIFLWTSPPGTVIQFFTSFFQVS